MKKYILSLLTMCATHMNIETIHLEPLTHRQNTVPTLSIDQLLLLNDIQAKVSLYAPIVISQWNSNENVQILIEDAELAVQQSTPNTQELMKSRIVDIFQDFDIDITFTSANSIELKTYRIDNRTKAYDSDMTHRQAYRTKKNTHPVFFGTNRNLDRPVQPKALPRIHGARRTMNRLKKEREARAKQEKEEEELIRSRMRNIDFFKEMMAQREPLPHQEMSPDEFASQEG